MRWESAGEGEYTIESVDRPQRGTEVVLHLREGHDDLLSRWRLATIIRKYSDHIALPIVMRKEVWDEEKKAYRTTEEDETVNQASALWARPKSEITQEQYDEFYKHVAHDSDPPLAHVHARVEGRTEYTQLLYIPSHAAFDLWDREHRRGLKLYVRRVFIMDDAEQLLPAYLRFVRGVVDSNDLPLNVSREILQESRDVEAIRSGCVKRVLGLLEDIAENDQEKYATFWKTFGKVLKEGFADDPGNRDKLAKLLRLASTHGDEADAERLPVRLRGPHEGRAEGDLLRDRRHLRRRGEQSASRDLPPQGHRGAPALRSHRRMGGVGAGREFEGKPLRIVAKGALDLDELADAEEKARAEKEAGEMKPLAERLKASLGDKVKDVRVTMAPHRVACLSGRRRGRAVG